MAIFTVLRAAFGYLFLVLMVRIVGRRPGKQLTAFEYVLVFYLGGLTLTGVVGREVSLTNAVCQILTIALCHYALSWLRFRFKTASRILDGSPLILLSQDMWRSNSLRRMRLQDDDVMDAAREQKIKNLNGIDMAVLEPVGEIAIVPRAGQKDGQKDGRKDGQSGGS